MISDPDLHTMSKYEHCVLRPSSGTSKAVKYDDMRLRTLLIGSESTNRCLHGQVKELAAKIKFKDAEILRLQNQNAKLIHRLTSRSEPVLEHMQKEMQAMEAQVETDKKKMLRDVKLLTQAVRGRENYYDRIVSQKSELQEEIIQLKQTITDLETLRKADEEVMQSFTYRNDELMETVEKLCLVNAELQEQHKDEKTKWEDEKTKWEDAKTKWEDWHVQEMNKPRVEKLVLQGFDYPMCPVTFDVLTRDNAFVASDGHTYSEEALKKIISTTKKSPMTRDLLEPMYKPNYALLKLMDAITAEATKKDRKQAEAFVEASLSSESPISEA
jgi:hypothetical protein